MPQRRRRGMLRGDVDEAKIRWAHLANLRASSSPRPEWNAAADRVRAGVEREVETRGRPDLVLVSGGVASAGEAEDHAAADRFLASIEALRGARLVPVPGTSDVTPPAEGDEVHYAGFSRYEDTTDRFATRLKARLWERPSAPCQLPETLSRGDRPSVHLASGARARTQRQAVSGG